MANDEVLTRRCATHEVSTGDRARMAELERGFRERARVLEAQLSVNIPVAFIHVVDGDNGSITSSQRAKQIAVMNDAFAPIGIDFSYNEDDVVVVNDSVFYTMGHSSEAERNCKTTHQAFDPEEGLNFYTANPGGGLLGWATFPFEMQGDPKMDGVVMLHSTLPEGSADPFNLGLTAVHEVGHWLSLYHTFQDACFGDGDEVDDTPAHAAPNFGKPADDGQPHNLCPNEPAGSLCPIHNYMNYVDDDWMNEFTEGQKERIWAQVNMFRSGLFSQERRRELDLGVGVTW